MAAGVASQDYRDGAAMGARIMAERIVAVQLMGIKLDDSQVRAMAEEVRTTYGGAPIGDGFAREAARVL